MKMTYIELGRTPKVNCKLELSKDGVKLTLLASAYIACPLHSPLLRVLAKGAIVVLVELVFCGRHGWSGSWCQNLHRMSGYPVLARFTC